MKTSYTQYIAMVEFMEKFGDLSKLVGGPLGRHQRQMQWKELTNKLNNDGTGDLRSDEKWRKVWSDFKNNTKKKLAKINKSLKGTSGGTGTLALTDLEKRVLQIIGTKSSTGIAMAETDFDQDEEKTVCHQTVEAIIDEGKNTETLSIFNITDLNAPGTSGQLLVSPHSSLPDGTASAEEQWTPPIKKIKVDEDESVAKFFVESDRNAKEYAKELDRVHERLETERLRQREEELRIRDYEIRERERDRIHERLETERLRQREEELRIRDYEIRERVRQRDAELQLQAQWLDLVKECMKFFVTYVEKKDERQN